MDAYANEMNHTRIIENLIVGQVCLYENVNIMHEFGHFARYDTRLCASIDFYPAAKHTNRHVTESAFVFVCNTGTVGKNLVRFEE